MSLRDEAVPHMDLAMLADLAHEPLAWQAKGFPPDGRYATPADVQAARPQVPGDGFTTPIAVLSDAALRHNVEAMATFCAEHDVLLAPHGKTTMAPQLFRRQLEAGAWGITVATPWQLRVAWAFGVRRLLLANELADESALRWLATELATDPRARVRCYVDDVAQVERLGAAMRAAGGSLQVLVEVGVENGRTGARSHEEVLAVAQAAHRHHSLQLVGVAGYEGIIGHVAQPDVLAKVRGFLGRIRRAAEDLEGRGLFVHDGAVLLTAGGSAFFDQVVQVLSGPLGTGRPVRVVLRSGAYVSHDEGRYAQVSPLGRNVGTVPLRPAVTVWARVLSRPEPGRAVVDAGRRDLPEDAGLPTVRTVVPADGGGRRSGAGLRVTALNDQHGYVDVGHDQPLGPGDLLALGISHPCTFFDKWTWLPVVDEQDRATDVVRTYF